MSKNEEKTAERTDFTVLTVDGQAVLRPADVRVWGEEPGSGKLSVCLWRVSSM